MRSTPLPTAIALLATLAMTGAVLPAFLAGVAPTSAFLLVLTALFGLRVAGQIVVALERPRWLPPMHDWNFVPYGVLLPAQLVIIGAMGAVVAGYLEPRGPVAHILVGLSFVYWAAMGVRYAWRMLRRPGERWLGGTIPIVFHCVLAAFLFVLGVSHAG